MRTGTPLNPCNAHRKSFQSYSVTHRPSLMSLIMRPIFSRGPWTLSLFPLAMCRM